MLYIFIYNILYINIYNITPKRKYGRIYIPRVKNKTVICHLSLTQLHVLCVKNIKYLYNIYLFCGSFFAANVP